MLKINEISIPNYEKVLEVIDEDCKLHGFIVIHNTRLGPALGGLRLYPYKNPDEALKDALRLAQGMTYKSALSGTGFGGGKGVIIGDLSDKTESLLLAFAEAIHSLKGQYITAEDIGINPQDLLIICKKTPYVCALPLKNSSGDPSPYTAWGVLKGMQAVSKMLWKTNSLKNKRILIQGTGNVGNKLAHFLFWEGAQLILTDTRMHGLSELAWALDAKIVKPEEAYSTPCDIFAPCAIGGVINETTLPQFNCHAIAGSANNQLATPDMGERLLERNILYAPDILINAGGILNASIEFETEGYHAHLSRAKIEKIYDQLLFIFEKGAKEHIPPHLIAEELAIYYLNHEIGKRTTPLIFRPLSSYEELAA